MDKERTKAKLAEPDLSFIIKDDEDFIVKKETLKKQIVKKETLKKYIEKKKITKKPIFKEVSLKKDRIKREVADQELNQFNKWIVIAFAMFVMAITKAFILPLL